MHARRTNVTTLGTVQIRSSPASSPADAGASAPDLAVATGPSSTPSTGPPGGRDWGRVGDQPGRPGHRSGVAPGAGRPGGAGRRRQPECGPLRIGAPDRPGHPPVLPDGNDGTGGPV